MCVFFPSFLLLFCVFLLLFCVFLVLFCAFFIISASFLSLFLLFSHFFPFTFLSFHFISSDALPPVVSEVNFAYAAPEVFLRLDTSDVASLEEEQASDMYSLGVLLWELYTGRVPWSGASQSAVRKALEAGETLPLEMPDEALAEDAVRIVVCSVIQASFNPEPARRPDAVRVNNQTTALILA